MEEDRAHWMKIKTEDLKIGMFIIDMGRSWINHPFLTNKKLITSTKQIDKLKEYGILEVLVDPRRGGDIEREVPFQNDNIEKEEEVTSPPGGVTPFFSDFSSFSSAEKVPLHLELKEARKVHQEAQIVVREVMQDIRLGKNIESEKVKRVVQKMTDSIFRNPDALASLTRIKGYDEYTFVHSINVCILSLTLGRHLNLERESLEQMGIGALLHDVGKMKVPHNILQKRDKLSDTEFFEIKKHPLYSLEILGKTEGLAEESKLIALQHHERYAGHGYPFSLKREEIRQFAQIAAIADVYDAMTTERCYKKAASPYEALQEMYLSANRDFNQFLIERFIQCMGIYPIGTLVLLDTQEIGIVCSVNHQQLLRPHVLLLYKTPKKIYGQPVVVNLMEKDNDSGSFKRTILKPLNPRRWNICVDDYLSPATWRKIAC